MKKLSLFMMLISCLLIQAQNETLNEVSSLLDKFNSEQDLASLITAEKKVNELFESKKLDNNLKALLTKADVYNAILENTTPEEPIKYAKDLSGTYRTALETDSKMANRHDILGKVYKTKSLLVSKGNDSYVETDYGKAYDYFDNALAMNKIEIDYPRHMVLDTSILFSKAVFAKLSDKSKVAIADFERLVELKYNRADIYDYLKELYGKEGDDKNLKRIENLKSQRFPEK